MAYGIISAFRGIRYQLAESRDLSSRLTPPYDVIGDTLREQLYARDEHNFVRVELPRPSGPETEDSNRYTQAATTLEGWLTRGVMARDERPAFYALEQEFEIEGKAWRRRGVFAALRLPEEGERYVLSHEGTMAGPKADRLKLMQACATMTSPIMVMSEDADSRLLSGLRGIEGDPDASAVDDEGVVHRLWVVNADEEVEAICAAIGAGPLFIADGHHRFETAVTCRDRMRALAPDAPRNAGFKYALALVTSAQDEALKILPTHRLVSGLRARGIELMKRRINDWCTVEEIALGQGLAPAMAALVNAAPPGSNVFVAAFPDKRWRALTVRREKVISSATDVSVLHEQLFDPVLAEAGEEAKVAFVHDERAMAEAVERGECDFAFFLRPASVRDVLRAARAGEHMPQKSTFFYPKAPAGLVMSSLSAEPV